VEDRFHYPTITQHWLTFQLCSSLTMEAKSTFEKIHEHFKELMEIDGVSWIVYTPKKTLSWFGRFVIETWSPTKNLTEPNSWYEKVLLRTPPRKSSHKKLTQTEAASNSVRVIGDLTNLQVKTRCYHFVKKW